MNARVFTAASLLTAFAGTLAAADPQLMKLAMPDAKVMADVNVLQARLSPFGQFLLGQIESGPVQQLAAATGFDPRQDLLELMLVSNGTPGEGGAANWLVLASGVFNPDTIAAAATSAGATQEIYKGVAILTSPEKTESAAFLNESILVAGTVANVKAAIDRQASPESLPVSLVTQANQLSVAYDAWVLSTVSPGALVPAGDSRPANVGSMRLPVNVLQQVQSGYVGIKFGANVALTVQAQSDTAENATSMAGMLQLLGNLAQMQNAKNPDAAAFVKSLSVTAAGSTVNISASVPEAQFQQFLTPKRAVKRQQSDRK